MRLIMCFIFMFYTNMVYANIVSIEISKNIVSTAEFRGGDVDKPLVIFIHGFLQTRRFSTIKRLADSLNDVGYPILVPTLSLGISNRTQSLDCESIHLHSLDDEAFEIAQWVDWSNQQNYTEVILLGHSAGSVSITAYLSRNSNSSVKKTILTSLTYFGLDRPEAYSFENPQFAQKALSMIEHGNKAVDKFALSYCKEFITTAENYLSYYNWSFNEVIGAINNSISDIQIIIGSQDERISTSWLNALRESKGKVTIINGAFHFFDAEYEFDLLDAVESILTSS